MRKRILIFLLLLTVMPLWAELVARLPQVTRPLAVAMTNERVYVVEDSSQVLIFNRGPNGLAFKKTFGSQGDAPGELIEIYHLYPRKDHLEILTSGRFVRFSLDGRFLDEQKFPLRVFRDGVFRMGEKFLARDLRFDDLELSVSIRLYEKDFRNARDLVTHRRPLGDKLSLAADYCGVRVDGGQAYVVESGSETKVTVYDQAGLRQREFSLALEPVPLGPALKETLLKPFKGEPGWRAEDESLYAFPERTPGLDYFDIVDGKCIARTYEYRDDLVQFVLFDLQGRELNRVFLPAAGHLAHDTLFCFFQDRYYYLRRSPADRTWELQEEKAW